MSDEEDGGLEGLIMLIIKAGVIFLIYQYVTAPSELEEKLAEYENYDKAGNVESACAVAGTIAQLYSEEGDRANYEKYTAITKSSKCDPEAALLKAGIKAAHETSKAILETMENAKRLENGWKLESP